jgi:putative oxidoreductase
LNAEKKAGESAMENYQKYLPLIARLLMGVAFVWFACVKLFIFGPSGTAGYLASVWHAPAPVLSAWAAIIVEGLGGLAVIFGFKTRWAAAILALWCLFTGLAFHLPAGDPDNISNFLKNMVMAGGFLYIVAYGAGAISVDHATGTDKTA